MNVVQYFSILLLVLSFIIPINTNAGNTSYSYVETDTREEPLYAFFDLRDRESFIQITNVTSVGTPLHIQIYNVDQECNENNFFDFYTPNDTHTYNMRDILTNDGNPSGVVLPDNAYGVVVISSDEGDNELIGNLRILDDSGYEYRTNIIGRQGSTNSSSASPFDNYYFNFNSNEGVTMSDVVGVSFRGVTTGLDDPVNNLTLFDVDILDNNEVLFSCRNVIFACIDGDSPLQEAVLESAAENSTSGASVANFEYGINETISHSRNGELLCPNNVVPEGIVKLTPFNVNTNSSGGPIRFVGYAGLNNGNGRGTIDSLVLDNGCFAGVNAACGSLP